jgi:hypothetical protein
MLSPVEISNIYPDEIEFSFCTLVTKPHEYQTMLESVEKVGFNTTNSEFLFIDNSQSNQFDGFSGLKHFLNIARGKHIIILHQDIIFYDSIDTLRSRLGELQKHDPNWAIAGNAGAREIKNFYIRITHRNEREEILGTFPARVNSLDENFLILKRDARLTLSHDLKGFHFYASDLCFLANILGHTCYVIDFHVMHYGIGALTQDFYNRRNEFMQKYAKHIRPRFVQTTCTRFYIGTCPIRAWFLNTTFGLFLAKEYYKLKSKFTHAK